MARSLGASELRPLLETLADGAWHSGERLAQTAGITRAGLAGRVRKLEELGLAVETRSGLGYRLSQPLELLDADSIIGRLSAALRARLPVEVAFSTDSTNRRLMERDTAGDPQALLAEHQSAGRGRMGRHWHSPFGANLYLSLAWSFPQWPAALTALPLAVGVASAGALQACGLPALKLKWPNDLLVGSRKLGGILVEQRGEASGNCRVVIGLGVNVAMRSAETAHIDQPWTSLSEHVDRTVSRNALAAQMLEHWAAMLDRFALEGFAPFSAAWRRLDATYRRSVIVQAGQDRYTGIARGVDETGALQIDVDGRRRRLLSGEVSLRTAAP